MEKRINDLHLCEKLAGCPEGTKHYYISSNGARSGLTAMERKLARIADDLDGWVVSEERLNSLVECLKQDQEFMLKKNPRLSPVDIRFSQVSTEYPAFLHIGQHYIVCHPVKGWDKEDGV